MTAEVTLRAEVLEETAHALKLRLHTSFGDPEIIVHRQTVQVRPMEVMATICGLGDPT